MTDNAPSVPNSPGIRWRRRNGQWEAFWRARSDLVRAGFTPKNVWLWRGHAPSEFDAAHISDTCVKHQDEMLLFSRGGLPESNTFDGTVRSLINCYQNDPDSTYQKLRYHVRIQTDFTLRRIARAHGDIQLADIKGRTVKAWHDEWSGGGERLSIGHRFVAQLRTLCGFGFTLLEDDECERLVNVLGKMKFATARQNTDYMTADQAVAIRKMAHEKGFHSIALAQAFQFDLMLRQKDLIGEWVPLSEPGTSDVTGRKGKWLRGIRWSEIDGNLILRHVTSKKLKDLEVDLKLAPMVMEELFALGDGIKSGPLIVCELTGEPWDPGEFRRKFRIIANTLGIPKEIKNMHSRAGGISEATDAGADLEHIRHAAKHSNISMTQKYSRNSGGKIANVMQLRSAHRNKKGKE